MKFAYFYVSSVEIADHGNLASPPQPAILSIECDSFPKKIDVVLNIAVVDITDKPDEEEVFSLEIDIFCNDKKVESYKDIYEPFRAAHILSSDNHLASRYSFVDTFLANQSGVYTFVARLYDGSLPLKLEDKGNYIHQTECSVIVAKGWK